MSFDHDEFIKGYIGAALWTGVERKDDDPEKDRDKYYDATPDDLTDETRETMETDCLKFLSMTGVKDSITDDNFTGRADGTIESRAGHDFWLTRNGHGAGFWDGDWTDAADKVLTPAAKGFGECNLFLQDDDSVGIM